MRVLPLVFALLPTVALAEAIPLTSRVSEVTLFPQGAMITRAVPFEAPAGAHELRLIDLPRGTPMESLRIRVTGATMGAVSTREDFVPPRPDDESAAVTAARDEVARLEEAMRAKADEAAAIRAAGEAADTRIGFLRQLGQGDALSGVDVDTLRDVSRMVGEETLAARRAALDAEGAARVVDREVKELSKELEAARQALAALVPETGPRNLVAVGITAEDAAEGMLEIIYFHSQAGWSPVYDAYLDLEASQITLGRGALVRQETGENWQDVALTLSTNQPSGAVEPGELWPELRRIADPEEVAPLVRSQKEAMSGAMAEMPMADAMVTADRAVTEIGAFSVTYTYPGAVDLASGADEARLALDDLTLVAETMALAVPKRDETAFLVAEFTNTSGEMILPSVATQLYRDGEFLGETRGRMIPAGGEARLGFGPIEGLRLKRLAERIEGDRGILSRSTRLAEKVRIEAENLTGQDWRLRLLDQVPYSEQEDLVITWNAEPRPQETDVEDKKGVLGWQIEIGAGEMREIELNYSLEWPEGKVLR
ncbi:DUF4139 domain-containing protein [Aquicoccus porphyridii]|uniref:DUF4139 domain-containing protein n=1 Tax=Aquicoccus porphyridii TaxID=1852029 RepID=A0A5A9Z760_9RHOB|nr:DUF4139 domain-containing protein [Aquicoccus porphyridii]KAA0913027.1 DUF4139 domain-containing protein [Aquicoccus porphyridii]RAI54239.1 hypothetical protein DOO74_08310 [Rhodobacteraceae bacterium AsT-22]